MAWFTCAVRRPIGANTGGRITSNWGLVLHHAVANGSLFSFFNNPSAQVSAHFWVGKNGTIEQYVDTDIVAWHGKSLNTNYVGVETEGCTQGPAYAEPMTDQMIDALSRIYREGNQRHGWPNALANAQGQRGFGYHRMAVNTACPCDVRLQRRQEILNRSFSSQPPTPPTIGDDDMVLLVQNPNNKGWAVLDVATGTYKGLSDPSILDFYQRNGVKTANPQPNASQWAKFNQNGTI